MIIAPCRSSLRMHRQLVMVCQEETLQRRFVAVATLIANQGRGATQLGSGPKLLLRNAFDNGIRQ